MKRSLRVLSLCLASTTLLLGSSLASAGTDFQQPVTGKGYQQPITGKGYQQPITGKGYQEPVTGKGYQEPVTGKGYQEPVTGKGYQQPLTGKGYQQPLTGKGQEAPQFGGKGQEAPQFGGKGQEAPQFSGKGQEAPQFSGKSHVEPPFSSQTFPYYLDSSAPSAGPETQRSFEDIKDLHACVNREQGQLRVKFQHQGGTWRGQYGEPTDKRHLSVKLIGSSAMCGAGRTDQGNAQILDDLSLDEDAVQSQGQHYQAQFSLDDYIDEQSLCGDNGISRVDMSQIQVGIAGYDQSQVPLVDCVEE
jgi:hypothetical protein